MRYYFLIGILMLQISLLCSGCNPTTPEGIVKKDIEIIARAFESGKFTNADIDYFANSWSDAEKAERIRQKANSMNPMEKFLKMGATIKTKCSVSNASIENGIASVDANIEMYVKLNEEEQNDNLPLTFYLQKNNNGEWKIIGVEIR